MAELHEIRSRLTKEVIFSGEYVSLKACVEDAARKGFVLDYADFRRANLTHANIDGLKGNHICFDYANLVGANLSESVIGQSSFCNASLQNVCFCEANYYDCDFRGALFGASDIAGAVLRRCVFDTLSCFSLNFIDAGLIHSCSYVSENMTCPMNSDPLVLNGLEYPIIFMDEHISFGSLVVSCDRVSKLNQDCDDVRVLRFVETHFDLIQAILIVKHHGCSHV